MRLDAYAWLRDRDDPDVLAHLEAENAYTDAMTAHLAPLRERLFEEFRSRIVETDSTVPVPDDGWRYYVRTVEGLQYEINCRKADRPDGGEEVVLDENVLAEGHDYFAIGSYAPSPDHALLAYSTDVQGDEVYTMRVRDLGSGTDLADELHGTFGNVAWASDNATFFYVTLDEARRPYRVWRHKVGDSQADDSLVYEEDDEAFHVFVGRMRTGAYVAIHVGSMTTSEVLLLRADDPEGAFEVLLPRRHGVEYWIAHRPGEFVVVTNDDARNFRCVVVPEGAHAIAGDAIPHDEAVKLDTVIVFSRHLVAGERADGYARLRVLGDDGTHVIEQPEEASTCGPYGNRMFDTRDAMFWYSSFVTPWSVYSYDLQTRERRLEKRQEVPGYDASLYATSRVWATAPDGVQVPLSVVHRTDTALDTSAPCLLYGYGAYEASTDPMFSSMLPSLLDRGFVYAVAHVRGGGELGRAWYEDGKLARKTNTFTDFIACAEHLVSTGYTSHERMVIRGGSAGGMLVGAVVNLRPDLCRAAVAEVPFVDCLNTLLDPSLPLTVIEWEEWGDPREPDAYARIRAYSPYDNVGAKEYPRLLVTAGLNDPRVGFWEPAKWVAKLRALKAGDNPILLRTELDTGHMGPSGRYDAWREEAFVYAFILDAVGGAD